MGQWLQPQPQEDLPVFLFLIKLLTISDTTAAKSRPMTILAIFSVIHAAIVCNSFCSRANRAVSIRI